MFPSELGGCNMTCPYCESENPSNAVYCKSCGKKIKGISVCQICGNPSPSDGVFCVSCGAELRPDGNSTAKHDSALPCVPAEKPLRAENSFNPVLRQKIFTHIGEAAALVAICFSFLFTFFIGCNATSSTMQTISETQNTDLFYYFSNAYRDLSDFLLDASLTSFGTNALYFPTIMGTIIAAFSVIVSIVFFAFGLTRYILHLTGRTQKSTSSVAIWSVLLFIMSAFLFQSVHAFHMDCISGTAGNRERTIYSVSMNGATITGIILSALLLVASATCRIAAGNRPKISLPATILCIAAMVLGAIIIALIGGASLSMKTGTTVQETSFQTNITFRAGFASVFSIFGGLDLSSGGIYTEDLPETCRSIMNYAIGGTLAQTVSIVCIVLWLAELAKSLIDGTPRRIFTIAYLSASIIGMILSTVFAVTITQPVANFTAVYIADTWTSASINTILTSWGSLIAANILCTVMIILTIIFLTLPPAKNKITNL